jgi:inner membrane protein
MMGLTHMLISGLAVTASMQTTDAKVIVCAVVASLLPDIDTSASSAGRVFFFVSRYLERQFPHRSCTHSLFASFFLGILTYTIILTTNISINIAHAINLGYFFGYFADIFTPSGCEIFWPSKVRGVWPGNRNYRLKTNSPVEYVLMVVLVFLLVLSIKINSSGGILTNFNKIIGSPAGVANIYNQSGATNLIVVRVKGIRSSDRLKVTGDYTIIEAKGESFLVQSKAGQIYKIGTEPDANIITESVTADIGRAAVTTIESSTLEDEELETALRFYDRKNAMVFVSGQFNIDDSGDLKLSKDPYQFPFIRVTGSSITLEAAPIKKVISYLGEEFVTGELQIRTINVQTPNNLNTSTEAI